MNLHKIAKVTRLNKLSKGKLMLIVAAVTWSALNCSGIGRCTAAEAASIMALGGTAITASADVTRLSGIPYRSRNGQIVVSGSKSDADHQLVGYEQQAQASYDRARASEPAITMDMLEISHELGTSMEGLEYSVKTASSVCSKIERKTDKAIKAGEQPKTATQYVEETGDLIRYTQVAKNSRLAHVTRQTVRKLEQLGYTVDKLDNKYLNPEGRYKAIHLDVTSPHGISFEMQLHSPETLEAGRATHGMYEEWRKPETSPQRKAQLYSQIKAVYDGLPQPKGIMELASYDRSSVQTG